MIRPHLYLHAPLAFSILLQVSCGSSSSTPKPPPETPDTLVPLNFQNTVAREQFADKHAEMDALLLQASRDFGVNLSQTSEAQNPGLVALQAFTETRPNAAVLSRSLQIEAAITLMSKLVSEKPSTCSAAVISLETFYNVLTASMAGAVAQLDRASLEQQANSLGLELEEGVADPSQSLVFQLDGKNRFGGLELTQSLDLSGGANDTFVYLKRDMELKSDLTKVGEQPSTDAVQRFHMKASGGIAADLLEQQLTLLDRRTADLLMTRNGSGVRGSSLFDVKSKIQGGLEPRIETALTLEVQGDGLIDAAGLPLYAERRVVTSQLEKIDSDTLRFTLNMAREGARGADEMGVQWLLEKNAQGQCALKRTVI